MDTSILDLSYLLEVSENDETYMHEVLKLFLETVPDKLMVLESKIKESDDFHTILHTAHFLKSSANIVKINNMHNNLGRIELLARQETGKAEMIDLVNEICGHFKEALPLILNEEKKYQLMRKS